MISHKQLSDTVWGNSPYSRGQNLMDRTIDYVNLNDIIFYDCLYGVPVREESRFTNGFTKMYMLHPYHDVFSRGLLLGQ